MEKKSKRHMWDCWVTPRFVSFATKPAPNFKIKVSAKFKNPRKQSRNAAKAKFRRLTKTTTVSCISSIINFIW